MIKPVLASRRSIGFMGTAAKPAAAASWWLSGGISASNCVAAYQPKGAASLAASYTNLASPGTYNAAPGVAPTWNATNGWKFNSTAKQYLLTNIFPNVNYSMVVCFSELISSGCLCGSVDANNHRFHLFPRNTSNVESYGYDGQILTTGYITSGVMCIAGPNAYRNGLSIGTISPSTTIPNVSVSIGARKYPNDKFEFFISAYIQAFSIYNTAISAAQVSALTTAMNAL